MFSNTSTQNSLEKNTDALTLTLFFIIFPNIPSVCGTNTCMCVCKYPINKFVFVLTDPV